MKTTISEVKELNISKIDEIFRPDGKAFYAMDIEILYEEGNCKITLLSKNKDALITRGK